MIVKFAKPGQSFKGVLNYLMHDAESAASQARVDWAHTFNLAHDHVPSAMDEMYTTWLNAETMKAAANVRAGGRTTQKPVKHVSLSWHPSEKPDKVQMLAATVSFLEHMGWDAHQAVVVAHNDKPHAHVHLVVNAIHPETGLKLDARFEARRGQEWAAAYEQSRGQEFCPQRGVPAGQRQASEPRPSWMAIKGATESEVRQEQLRLGLEAPDPIAVTPTGERRQRNRTEWAGLKATQRAERDAFFAEGKDAYRGLFRDVQRQVRSEFRPMWAEYYAARRAGLDPASDQALKQKLIDEQKETFESRRTEAAVTLRANRDAFYKELLLNQKLERRDLTDRQGLGLASPIWSEPRTLAADTAPDDALDAACERFGIRRGRGVAASTIGRDTGSSSDARSWSDTGSWGNADSGSERESELEFDAERETDTDRSPAPEPAPRVWGRDPVTRAPTQDFASGLASGLLALAGGLGESMTGGPAPRQPSPVNPLDRFNIRRGRPTPEQIAEQEQQRARREASTKADEWWEWRKAQLER